MITRIDDAPLPTVSPWADDPPDLLRCPACALANPGEVRCRRCNWELQVQIKRRKPITVNLMNLIIVMLGRGPMLIAIAFLYRSRDEPLLTPWTVTVGLMMPLFWVAAGGLTLRWRWTWYLAFVLALVDLLLMLGLQITLGANPILPIAAILADLMVMGFLLTVFDEVRIDTEPIILPPREGLPRTPMESYNTGVRYSEAGMWYFAARMYERAVGLGHHEGRYRRALAGAYLRLGEFAAAESELHAAHILMPDDPQTVQMQQVLADAKVKGKG